MNNKQQKANKPKPNKNGAGPNKPCFVCHERGHWPAECPKAICRKCGCSGHMASLCPSDEDVDDKKYRDVEELRLLEAAAAARKAREDAEHARMVERLERLKVDTDDTLVRLLPDAPGHEPARPMAPGRAAPAAGAPPPGGGGTPPDGGGGGGGGGGAPPPPGGGGEVVVLRPPPPPVTPVTPARAPRVMKRSFREPDDHELHDQRDIYISQVVDREPLDRRAAALKFAWAVLKASAKGALVLSNIAAFVTSAVATVSSLTAYDKCLKGFTPSEVRATRQLMMDSARAAGPVSAEATAAIEKYTLEMALGGGKAFETINQVTGCTAPAGSNKHRAWTVAYMWKGAMEASVGTIVKAAVIGAVGAAALAALWHLPALLEGLKGRMVVYDYLSSSYAPATTDMRPTSQKAREGFYQDALMATYEVVDTPAGWRGLLPDWCGYTVRRREAISMELFVALTEPRIQAITDVDKLKQAISHRAGIEDRIYTDRYLFSVNMVAATTAAFAWHYFMSKIRGQPPVFW